jgi:hypothetical protein
MTRPLVELFQENRATGQGCASPEEIWDAVNGRLGPERTAELVDHTIRCGDCAQLWRLAREAQAAEEQPRPAPVVRPLRWVRWSGVGAVGLAAAAMLLLVVRRPAVENPERGSPEAHIVNTTARELPREAFILRWAPVGPGARYQVEVVLADLTEIDRAAELQSPERQVPATALERVPAGTDVLWRIEARLPGGETVSSAPFRTRVR